MKTKEIKIEAPEGYEIDREKSTLERIVFKKKESTEEYIARKIKQKWNEYEEKYKDAFSALKSLLILRDEWNDGWIPDWNDSNTAKYGIVFCQNKIDIYNAYSFSIVLNFKSKELADKFAKQFESLILTAKPLL